MDLEDIPIADVPELAPFRFQEHIDFTLSDEEFADVQEIIQRMRTFDQNRKLG